MALNIKDSETEKAVRMLARRRGLTLTEAVRQAVHHELDKDELSEEEKERRVAAALARMEALDRKYGIKPAERSMTREEMDDAIGYDENGMW
ncbi:ribbon-helix-helix protein, CopG family [Bosea caraganae]|uniref:Ribbon-helix-helix protein, CopG family n=1 Tax=Bosea caraganae TaxID=2763117 RepID=A0A370L1D4_9HYPH|nr:type II toxin-antitoxin system VapB family antitoxin [Bosea caraganae]RDJ21044.1 ribbon-helix-helix protein, CopG family [Bosea caraganae]RDJ28543.1 ribbon-helix-helix protein, CopG family [Bosea caraganae]